MWLRDAREWAADKGLRGVPELRYRELFNEGKTPKEAAQALNELSLTT